MIIEFVAILARKSTVRDCQSALCTIVLVHTLNHSISMIHENIDRYYFDLLKCIDFGLSKLKIPDFQSESQTFTSPFETQYTLVRSDDAMLKFKKWLRNESFPPQPLAIADFASTGRGLLATKRIKTDIIRVPRSAILFPHDAHELFPGMLANFT